MPPISDSQRAARIKAVQEHFHIENTHDLDAVMAQNQHSCHQPPTRMSCSIREPLTLSLLQSDSGRRSAD
jgi:hypothetical protein